MTAPKDPVFYLLPYRILVRRWRTSSFLMIPGGVALYWAAPQLFPDRARIAPLMLGVSIVGFLLFVYTLIAAQARVTCERDHFTIRTPLVPVAFSYRRVELVRPVEFSTLFPLKEAKAAHQRIYYELWSKTVPTITLKGYPMSLAWLKLWFHPYLFHPKEVGLVIPVEDWMAFSRRLETLRTAHRQ